MWWTYFGLQEGRKPGRNWQWPSARIPARWLPHSWAIAPGWSCTWHCSRDPVPSTAFLTNCSDTEAPSRPVLDRMHINVSANHMPPPRLVTEFWLLIGNSYCVFQLWSGLHLPLKTRADEPGLIPWSSWSIQERALTQTRPTSPRLGTFSQCCERKGVFFSVRSRAKGKHSFVFSGLCFQKERAWLWWKSIPRTANEGDGTGGGVLRSSLSLGWVMPEERWLHPPPPTFIFLFKTKLFKNWSIVVSRCCVNCWDNKVIPLYIYTFFFTFFSIVVYLRMLNSALLLLAFLFRALLSVDFTYYKDAHVKHTIQWSSVYSQSWSSTTTISFQSVFTSPSSQRNLVHITSHFHSPSPQLRSTLCPCDLPILDIFINGTI